MSDFDLVRNRRRGEEAKNRVMNRLANPQPVQQQESAFDAVRNRASGYDPVRNHLEAATDRADRMMSSLPSEDVAAVYKPQTIQLNADRADRMMSTEDSASLRQSIETPKARNRLMPAEDRADLAYSKLGPEKQLQIERETRYASDPPVIEDIHRGLDKFADFVKPATDIAQTLYTPGAGLTVMNMGTQAAGNLISKMAPGLGKTLGGRVVKTGAQEAIVGAPLGAGMELSRTADEREALKGAAWGAGGGAALGAVGPVVGAALKKFITRPKGIPEIEQQVAPRERGNVNTAQTPEPLGFPQRATDVPSPATAEIRPDTKQVDFYNEQIKNHSDKAAYHENEIASHVKYLNRVGDRNKNEIMKRLDDVNADIAKRTAERTHHDVKVGDMVYWKDKWDVRHGVIDDIENGKARIYERTNGVGQLVKDMNIDHLSNDPNKAGVLTYSKEQLESLHNLKEVIEGKLAKTHDFNADDTVKYHTNKAKEYRSQEETVRKNLAWLSQESEEAARAAVNKNENQFDTVRNRNKPKATDETVSSAPESEAEEILKAVKEPRVRDRITSYLDDAEKAALERIAKRKNNLSSNPFDEWADHAIVVAAQLAKGTIKAATYTEDMVKLFGEQIRPHAQRVFSQAKEVLRQQERRASKEGQDAREFNESGIGDASTFGAKISSTANKKKGSFSQWWENTRTQLVDDVAPLEGLEKRVRGGKLASAEDSLYKAARMFKGVPEKSAQIVTKRLTPIVEAIEKAGYTSDELGKFALAKHAKDVNAAGFKSGFTNAEIESVLIKYDSDAMNAAQKELVKVNNDMLKELVDSGVVSRELSEVLNERWKNYIPLFRQMDEDAIEFETGLSKALANVANPIKSLKGSEKAVIDPLENMVKNIMRSTNAAERNKVALQLPKLAKIDTEGNFIRKLEPLEEVGRKNVVNVKVNGENVKYEVEPEVYKAILNLDKESSGMIINILAKPASLLRAGATLTPEFSLRNPMRDVVQAFIVSKSGFNPIIDFPVGIIQAISKGKLHQEWIDNLGAYGNIMSMDRNVHRQALEKVLGEPASKKFVNLVTGKSVIRLLRAISDTTESATKIGEYRAAIRSGVTPQEAAYRSRDIMDFARAGTGVRQANKIVAFLNANIQGKSRLIRAIKENPVGTTVRALTAVTIPTIGIYYSNKQFANETQRETIDNAPDWMRNSFWLVAVPGTDVVARIPKPFDLATIFSNLPERALDFVYKNDKKSFDGFLSQALKESALPAQISGLLPFIEGMSNYSFFRQGEIIPQRESGLKPQDQYDPVRTTETAKILSKGAEKLTGGKGAFGNFASPRIMDNTIQGLTAGLGKYATDAVDSILMGRVPFAGTKVSNPLIDRPEAPSKKLEQKPLLRSFLVDPTQGGKVMDQFYKEIDKLSKEKASNKLNERTFGKKDRFLPETQDKLLKTLNKNSDDVGKINKEIRSIEKSTMLTPQSKRKQIDVLMTERMKIVKDSAGLIK